MQLKHCLHTIPINTKIKQKQIHHVSKLTKTKTKLQIKMVQTFKQN